jgi:ribonucleoside-diphosphate reductase alpha chain
LEIPPEQHVRIQAAFQKHVDNVVSKTVNLPAEAPPQRRESCLSAVLRARLQRVTVYRYGSKSETTLEMYCDRIFEEELNAWHFVTEDWPTDRTG